MEGVWGSKGGYELADAIPIVGPRLGIGRLGIAVYCNLLRAVVCGVVLSLHLPGSFVVFFFVSTYPPSDGDK